VEAEIANQWKGERELELIINVQRTDGSVEVRHHAIKLDLGLDDPEIGSIVSDWSEKLCCERWLNWEIELTDEHGSVHETWALDDTQSAPLFYMLTNEGYRWNSEIREGMDIYAKKLYSRALNK
jgi:hypothetical protein